MESSSPKKQEYINEELIKDGAHVSTYKCQGDSDKRFYLLKRITIPGDYQLIK
jgi:hypothetical protein